MYKPFSRREKGWDEGILDVVIYGNINSTGTFIK